MVCKLARAKSSSRTAVHIPVDSGVWELIQRTCFRMTALMQIQWSLKGPCTRKMIISHCWPSEGGPPQSTTHYQPVRVLFWTNWKQCVPKRHQLSFMEVGLSHTSPPPFGAPTDRCRTRRCSMALRLQAVIRARLGRSNGATGL